MIEIQWATKAVRQLRKFTTSVQQQVFSGVARLSDWPQVQNVKKLKDRDDYRLRVGDYRVFFTIHPDGTVTVIRIEEVKKRDEHTY